jgi:hypothetical protein
MITHKKKELLIPPKKKNRVILIYILNLIYFLYTYNIADPSGRAF